MKLAFGWGQKAIEGEEYEKTEFYCSSNYRIFTFSIFKLG
jgi:hypothetical protein